MGKKQFKGIAGEFVQAMKAQFIGQGADPNKIIVQDLFTYNPPTQNSGLDMSKKLKVNSLDELRTQNIEDRNIISSLLSVYNDKIANKREIIQQARNLFNTDIIQTVVDVMIDDGFNSFQNEKEEFIIKYDPDDDALQTLGEEYRDKIQELIDDFVNKFSLKTRIPEMVPDLIRDGEYAYGVLFDENDKKGITEICDDFDVINMLPFYDSDKLSFVINQNIIQDEKQNNLIGQFNREGTKPAIYKADNIVFFRLNNTNRLRINMSNFYDNTFRKTFYERTHLRLPKYVRSALPLYYGAIPLLNRLKIMENVSTVLDLNDILKPEIVHVTVPSNTSPVEAEQIMRDYERHLNDMSSLSGVENLDLGTLTAQANRRKVLPMWMDTKGTLTSAAVNQAAKGAAAWDSIDKLRNLIALSIGIPPFYINISANPIGKAETIKLYSRYTRKLTSLQKSLADGIKDLILIHLDHCGIKINRSNLKVSFKALTSADALDDTDLLLGLVNAISDMYEALHKITQGDDNNFVLDDEQFKAFFDRCTSTYLNTSNLIRIVDDKFESVDGEDGNADIADYGFMPDAPVSDDPTVQTAAEKEDKISKTNNNAYDSFVSDSKDIGISGVDTNIEDI